MKPEKLIYRAPNQDGIEEDTLYAANCPKCHGLGRYYDHFQRCPGVRGLHEQGGCEADCGGEWIDCDCFLLR